MIFKRYKMRLTLYNDLTQIYCAQSCPQLSEVTACQVLIAFDNKQWYDKDDMIGIKNKREFENLLSEKEAAGEDPMLFIRDKIRGKHISGNHRYTVKMIYKSQNRDKFNSKPYWYLTLCQMYIGLRPDQAR